MSSKAAIFAGALLLATSMVGGAQPVSAQTAPARDAVKGDPGAKRAPVSRRERAAAVVRSDKQAPGTETGNQPDRAAAAGGAH